GDPRRRLLDAAHGRRPGGVLGLRRPRDPGRGAGHLGDGDGRLRAAQARGARGRRRSGRPLPHARGADAGGARDAISHPGGPDRPAAGRDADRGVLAAPTGHGGEARADLGRLFPARGPAAGRSRPAGGVTRAARWEDDMDVRKVVVIVEEIRAEAGRAVARPIVRAAAVAVIANPFAGRFVDDLSALFDAGARLGEELMPRLVERLGGAPVSYGKAALVGAAGEVEHGAAVLHPKLGKPMRAALGGGEAIISSNVK